VIDAEQVKEQTRIEEIVAEDEPLRAARGGRRFEGQNHHSLTVYPASGKYPGHYEWFSQNERGDVFDWLRHHRNMTFTDALAYLARRAGLDLDWSPEQEQAYRERRTAEDVYTAAARHWAKTLHGHQGAMAYCAGRGWDPDTVKRAGLGYSGDGDAAALRAALQAAGVDLACRAAQAVLRCPGGMLIYPHVEAGRVAYWSARSASAIQPRDGGFVVTHADGRQEAAADWEQAQQAGKRHYNPPADLAGKRRPYFNHAYTLDAELVAVVEGQADGISLAQWGVAGVSLAGLALPEDLAAELVTRHKAVVLALDDDEEGRKQTAAAADLLGPLARVVRWPAKDVNAWSMDGGSAESAMELLRESPTWISLVARGIQTAPDRDAALRHMVELASQLTEFQLGTRREDLAKLADIGVRQLDNLLKRVRAEQKEAEEQEPARMMIERTVPGGVVATEEGDVVFEMIVNGNQSAFVVRWPNGKIETVRSLEAGGVVYYPYEATTPLIEKGVVLLPSALGDYGSTQQLVEEIRSFIHWGLDISSTYERIATYYVLLSWLFDCFTVLPYLRALGDYGTGKSRFLEVIGSICYRPIKTSGASTFSPVFRVIEMFHGSLILDEMDMTMSDTEADFMKLLNSGVARGTPLLRTEKVGDRWEVEAYDCFGPKIVATRKRFQDRALESRMLTYEMGAGCRDDIPLVLPALFYECAQDLRNKLLAYRLRNWRRMEVDYNLADRTVEPRLSQVTLALKTVVDDPELQQQIDEFIREYYRQTVVERGMTLSAVILEVIVELHNRPTEIVDLEGNAVHDLSVKTIAKLVNERLDEENYPDEDDSKKRPKLTPRKVGEEVRKLGLGTRRKQDKSRAFEIIWDEERIRSLKVRYGID
jgi:YD repeat-containing protein